MVRLVVSSTGVININGPSSLQVAKNAGSVGTLNLGDGTSGGIIAIPDKPGLGVRIRLEPTTERFDDLRLGPQTQQPSEQCGDLLARSPQGVKDG